MNDGCLLRDEMYSVEIDLEGLRASDIDIEEVIADLEKLSGISGIKVGYELGDHATVLRVVVIVDSEETGTKIAEALITAMEDCAE